MKEFNNARDSPISLTTFFTYKPFYYVLPSEREKQSCVCINCQNTHLLLQAINYYRSLKKLQPHESLTVYIQNLKSRKKVQERGDDKACTFHKYESVLESYTRKDGTPAEYKRVTRVNFLESIKNICQRVLDSGNAYLKHRMYFNNCSSVFPLMKEGYNGKYIDLDFSQNLALRPMDEVQSAHFSGKQFTLHFSVVDPVHSRCYFHISNDATHNPVFVDHVLRDIIIKYDIRNQDLWSQNANGLTQYKNKNAFFLLEKLAKEFSFRIIRIYGAAGHGKGL